MLSIVVAAADNGVIGINNTLPWRLTADLARFKALTMGKPMVMGRKTFESLGRVLPGRPHIVISRSVQELPPQCHSAGSLEHAIAIGKTLDEGHDLMVIGGGEIYRQALIRADRIFLTRVHIRPEGDTWFDFDTGPWSLVEEEHHSGDPSFSFLTYMRRHDAV